MREHPIRWQAGFTFAELAFGLVILVVGAAVLINHLAVNFQTTNAERERVFAFSKAQAILAEVQNYVDRGQLDAADLDTLDDGTANKTTLSIQTDGSGVLVAPDHVVSGNWQRTGFWQWSRRITVQPFASADNRNVRYVTVRVYKRDQQGNDRALADLSAVVNSSGESYPSSQVFDVYFLAIENIPGWWVYMDSLRPFMEAQIMDLQTRNPGLELRTHWITKASFGRNPLYRPYTNNVLDSIQPIPDVYHYPGRMPTGSASSFYYVPDNIKARINVEGLEANGHDNDLNPHPYALADYFNHAMRYPAEKALWEARVAAIEEREQEIADAIAASTTPPAELGDMSKEPTLRLLLEDLNTDPAKYRNAIVVNLHGEMTPMPALRNYSDPARDPELFPGLRVVTHPEELRTRNNDGGVTDDLRFRMYAFGYETSATTYASTVMSVPMVVEFVGVDLTRSSDPSRLESFCSLENVPGGTPVGGVSDYQTSWQTADHGAPATSGGMYYRAEWVPPDAASGALGFTRVYLFNTPIGAPTVVDGVGATWGLANSDRARLYQMEYVPCPLNLDASGAPTFLPDLTQSGVGPKNTARWRMSIAPNVLSSSRFVRLDGTSYDPPGDVTLEVRTRIASDFGGAETWPGSGATFPTPVQPENLSVTYAWWTNSRDDVPVTERYQFQGDPRHLPYKDCFRNGGDFPNAYNWYHDLLNNTDYWTGLAENAVADFPSLDSTLLRNRWVSSIGFDAPRFLQLLREGLVKGNCVFSQMSGTSNSFLGLGGEIGYEAQNGYPNSIPTEWAPYGSPGAWGYMNSAAVSRRYVRVPTSAWPADYWWGIPWLGELVPDSHFAQWLDNSSGAVRGNLAAGSSTDQFYQYPNYSAYVGSSRQAYGTRFYTQHHRMMTGTAGASYGCTTLFNIGTSASTFQYSSASTNGTLSTVGSEIATNFALTSPSSAPIARPWRINASTVVGEHWNYAPYANVGAVVNRYSASIFQTYYSHAAGTGSGVVKLVDPAGVNAAYMVVNGIAPTVTNGSTFVAQWNLVTLVHTLLAAGSTSNSLRIKEQPRVEIEAPTDITELDNPSTITVQWSTEWTRWDGIPYTATGTFSESEAELQYCVVYSRDGGTNWLYAMDDTAADLGERPDAAYLIADSGAGDESFAWDVSSGFPEGTYLLRVQAFRSGTTMHHAYHQTRLFIQR